MSLEYTLALKLMDKHVMPPLEDIKKGLMVTVHYRHKGQVFIFTAPIVSGRRIGQCTH
jgi:hypothetical protein